MLVHISLEPRTVEKRWCGRGKALYKGAKERYFSYHYCYHLASAVVSNKGVVDGAWSSIDAFNVNKVHIFIFSQYLPDLGRGESNYSVAESTVFFFINTRLSTKKVEGTGF